MQRPADLRYNLRVQGDTSCLTFAVAVTVLVDAVAVTSQVGPLIALARPGRQAMNTTSPTAVLATGSGSMTVAPGSA